MLGHVGKNNGLCLCLSVRHHNTGTPHQILMIFWCVNREYQSVTKSQHSRSSKLFSAVNSINFLKNFCLLKVLKNVQNVEKTKKRFFFSKNFTIFFQKKIFFFRNEISYPENPRNRKIFSIGFDLVEQQAKKNPQKSSKIFFSSNFRKKFQVGIFST